MKIRIVEPGLSNFNGAMGEIEFVDGVSVENLSRMQVDRIGAIIRVENMDGDSVGPSADLLRYAATQAAIKAALPRQTDSEKEAEQTADAGKAEAEKAAKAAAKAEAENQESAPAPTGPWTEESLAAVADKEGIAGLRQIADPLNVKGRAVRELIKAILDHQTAKAAEAPKQ